MDLLINRSAADLDAAQACHRAAFGLRPERCIGDAGMDLLGGSAPLGLLAKAGGSRSANGQLRNNARHLTPLDMDAVTPDLESALARTEAMGLCREGKLREANWSALCPHRSVWTRRMPDPAHRRRL